MGFIGIFPARSLVGNGSAHPLTSKAGGSPQAHPFAPITVARTSTTFPLRPSTALAITRFRSPPEARSREDTQSPRRHALAHAPEGPQSQAMTGSSSPRVDASHYAPAALPDPLCGVEQGMGKRTPPASMWGKGKGLGKSRGGGKKRLAFPGLHNGSSRCTATGGAIWGKATCNGQ